MVCEHYSKYGRYPENCSPLRKTL